MTDACRDCLLPRVRTIERCAGCEIAASFEALFTAEMVRRHEAWDAAVVAAHAGCETARLDRPPHPGLLAAFHAGREPEPERVAA